MTGAATAGWRVPLVAVLSLLPRQVHLLLAHALLPAACLIYHPEHEPGQMTYYARAS